MIQKDSYEIEGYININGVSIPISGSFFLTKSKKGKELTSYLMKKVWDIYTERRTAKLHPVMRDKVTKFINEADKQGIRLRVTDGLRTYSEQEELYAKGRTASGKIVTNAKAGQSYHNFGLAVDVVEIKDGKPIYVNPNWDKIGEIGKSFGFQWGGDWVSFKDRPHFEYQITGKSLTNLDTMIKSKDVDSDGYVVV